MFRKSKLDVWKKVTRSAHNIEYGRLWYSKKFVIPRSNFPTVHGSLYLSWIHVSYSSNILNFTILNFMAYNPEAVIWESRIIQSWHFWRIIEWRLIERFTEFYIFTTLKFMADNLVAVNRESKITFNWILFLNSLTTLMHVVFIVIYVSYSAVSKLLLFLRLSNRCLNKTAG